MLGLIGRKVGMTQVFDEKGVLTPVTVIKFDENVVVSERTEEKEGYTACVLASVDKKANRVTKPVAGQYPDGVAPKKYIREFRDFEGEYTVGQKMGVEIFEDMELVDVIGTTKGKGYQGVMKRHNFGGGRKTHGSKFHRANGSTGMAAYPSKVIKGTKMAGRMGADKKTVQNLQVVRVDADRQVLLVKGAVPGTVDSMVIVREATKTR
jgi:large subunit ribosomal protein L3